MSSPGPIYLDHHSTTPCAPEVVEAMLPYFAEHFGNAASRSHAPGKRARAAVEHARAQVAGLAGVSPKEVVFTSGATEADNLALLGVAEANAARGRHVVVSAIEHKAVLDSADYLERAGFSVTRVPVGATGLVDPEAVAAALRDDTVLVSVMLANNEVGTVQPIAAIAERCAERGVPVHTDAVQAPGWLSVDAQALGVDLMSLSAHKMYGPKGVGALVVRRRRPAIRLAAQLHGGGHERGHRPGTLPVPLIVGFGRSAELALGALNDGTPDRVRVLRDRLLDRLTALEPDRVVHGDLDARLPHNLNVSFPGVSASSLMSGTPEVAVSSGSACSSETLEPSYVLRALGVADTVAHAAIRFGLGRSTTAEQVDRAAEQLAATADRLRTTDPSPVR